MIVLDKKYDCCKWAYKENQVKKNICNLYLLRDATCNIQKVFFLLFPPCCITELIKFRLILKAKKFHGKALDKVMN